MVEDFDTLDVRQGADDESGDVMRKINSTFGKLLGVEFGFNELQCLTQQELISFLQSSENLKKLYHAKIIDIDSNDNDDKVKDSLRMYVKYLKPVVEKYGTDDKLFESVLYIHDLLNPKRRVRIDGLLDLMDFLSEHVINEAAFNILKKLSEDGDFTPMNIRYKVIAVENYLKGRNLDHTAKINYKEIKRQSILLESREKGAWISSYGKIIPLEQCGYHDATAEDIIFGDEFLSKRLGEYEKGDYREFLVQEGKYVKFTGKKFFRLFKEFERDCSHFSFPTNSITNRPQVTPEQLDAIIDICGTIPKELL